MKKYRAELVLQQNRLKKSLSIKSKLPKPKQPIPSPTHKRQQSIKLQYEVPQVNKLLEEFQKEIKKPIEFHLDVLNLRSPPKCISHNNIQTLYCINDRKPLCVNCLYMSHVHKPHKVVPLQKAKYEVEENIKEAVVAVNRQLEQCQKIKKANDQYLQKAQREMPVIIEKLHTFYLIFHELLVKKKNEQIQQISEFWSKIRHTYHSRNSNISLIKNYLKNQLDNTHLQPSQSSALHTRNITTELAKIQFILDEGLSKEKTNHFNEDLSKFHEIRNLVQAQMAFQSNEQEQKSKNPHGISNSRKSPKSPSAQKTKKWNDFKEKNLKKETELKEQGTKESEMSLATSKRKNRHSKTDLLSKTQVLERRKSQELSLSKSKNKQLHQMIKIKAEKQKRKIQISPSKDKNSRSKSKNISK